MKILSLILIILLSGCNNQKTVSIQSISLINSKNAKIQLLKKAQELYSSFTTPYIFPNFSDKRRTKWEFLPTGIAPRLGISLAEMNNQQKINTHRFFATLLSSQGYLKVNGIIHLDGVLKRYFNTPKMKRSQEEYYLTFFGSPTKDKNWSLMFEGHHLSLNFTFANMQISTTPLFLGTNPTTVQSTEYAGWRILGKEEDKAFALLNSLSAQQKTIVIAKTKFPKNILTGPQAKQRLDEYWGISAKDFTPIQKKHLLNLINEYANNYHVELAEEDKSIIKSQLNETYFYWIGSQQEGKSYYYLIHSPTFIIELHSRQEKKTNHIHSIWRHKNNDFGADILQNHLNYNH